MQCVGTPWLVLSGGEHREYWLNGVPFASLYPHCDHYPCANWTTRLAHAMLPDCLARGLAGGPTRCASVAELESRLPDILTLAGALIRQERPYLQCAREQVEAIRRRLDAPPEAILLGHVPDVLTEAYVFPAPR